jgi:FKBP-type peptidyl-prolyl cis-trans isomerase FkpA
MTKAVLAISLAAMLIACSPVDQSVTDTGTESAGGPIFETETDRTLYALGVVLGGNIEEFSLTASEVEFVAAGIRDAALGDSFAVEMDVYGPQIQELANERMSAGADSERSASAAFADAVAAEPGAQRMDSGLIYVSMTEGDGDMPAATDTVLVHYHGTLRDGSVFDSSVDRGEPITFPLNGVIPCWTEGVQMMRVGGKAKLVCPAEIAYGDTGTGPIPGGATLLFEVELLGIE